MDRFESMSAFVAVVEAGGFSAAARRLAMPLATVSRKVSELENQLRVQLLTRTTRKVALTDIGRYHFETCRRLLEELDEAERLATGEYGAPRGDLIVTAPLLFGRLYLAPIVTEFLAAYAEVDVQLRLADRIANLGEEGVDIAIRVGHLPDSTLKAVKLGVILQVVCASPDYLARNGIPERLTDLSLHHSITCTSLEALREWTFRTRREMIRVPVRSRLSVSTAEAAADAAVAGLGITRLLCYQVSAPISDGRLRLLLRDYEPEPLPVHLVYQTERRLAGKLTSFIDFVVPRMKQKMVFNP